MLDKLIVQGISGLLLLSAALMFVIGAQAGAFNQKPSAPAPLVAAAVAQAAPVDLF